MNLSSLKMNKKAAIEFSANVIVIIIISSVILALGLMLFFNMKGQAEKYTDTIEQQTQEQLQALMLNDNSRVAIYPNDLTIQAGKSQMTTVAVTNIVGNRQTFQTPTVDHWEVTYFATPESNPQTVTHANIPNPPNNPLQANFRNTFIVSETSGNSLLNYGYINPGEQEFKNVLVKIPKNWQKGQYVVNINVSNQTDPQSDGGNAPCRNRVGNEPPPRLRCPSYGFIKLYITVP